MSANDLQALSALVTWLRTAAVRDTVDTFRRRTLARLRERLPFDRAIWADAQIAGRLTLRAPELVGIAAAELPAFEAAASVDPRLPRILADSGTAFAYSVAADDPAAYRTAVAALGLDHFLSIAHFDPVLGIASGIVLFAAPGRPAFDAHRAFVEAAFPHLREAWIECQVNALVDATGGSLRPRMGKATAHGLLITAAQDDFVAMLQLEWPDWSGPRVPSALVNPMTQSVRAAYQGRRIVVEAAMAVDAAVIVVRLRSPIDDLTARERAVAELCAVGLSYKEIAGRLGIAPSTARNHIAAIHRRLGVKRNSEVGGLLAQAAASWPRCRTDSEVS